MRSVRAALDLVRWPNALISTAGVLVGAWWAGADPVSPRPLIAAAVAVLLTGFVNADNDVQDFEIDRLAHPQRPIPAGRLTLAGARRIAHLCGALAIALSASLGLAFALGTVSLLLAMLWYSRGLKETGLAGNVTVAVVASAPFVYGAWSVGRVTSALPLLLVSMPLHFAREIAKDLDDAHGDAGWRRTLPLTIGPGRSVAVLMLSLAAFTAALVPLAVQRPLFGALIIPALALCVVAGRRALRGMPGAPRLLKSAMVGALTALVAASRA